MKVGTLTFHTAHNYGAMLQAYALVKYLQSKKSDAEVIDYQAEFNAKRFKKKTITAFLKPRALYGVLFQNSFQFPAPQAFTDFYDNYINKSEVSYTKAQLPVVADAYDKVIVGSDQIWNLACTDGDDAYFLPFISDSYKKYAYAASFGVSEIRACDRDKVATYISDFTAISVREKEGVAIVNKLTDKKATHVVDPTMLLNKQQWEEIADYSRCPNEPYLLVYLMSEDKALLKFARRYAKQNGLKAIYISQRLFKPCGFNVLRDVTPCQWLGLFLKANTVVTNSFHGCAFAINFGKNFFLKYIPRSIANSRMSNLVEAYNLHSHLLTEGNMNNTTFEPLNYDYVREMLMQNRKISETFIATNILSNE
jgi:hypothetical protein